MPSPRHIVSLGCLANALAGAAIVLLLATAVLWTRSFGGVGDETFLETSDNRLHLISRDGRIILAVTETDPPTLWGWGWRRRGSNGINWMINDPGRYFFTDFYGWGVALPHWLVAGMLLVVPAWWWIVSRDLAEFRRRNALGLCRHCGYDLRASPDRCPECGAPASRSSGAGETQEANASARSQAGV